MVAKSHVTFEVHPKAVEYASHPLTDEAGFLLRIDHKDVVQKMPIQDWLELNIFGPRGAAIGTLPYLCVFETKLDPRTGTKSNPHYHALFFINSLRGNALRQTFKRAFRGNGEYSLIKIKPDLLADQFNYICKGSAAGSDDKPDIRHRSEHFTDEFVSELHVLYWKNNAAIQMAAKKRKRETSVHENILTLCRSRGYTDTDKGKIFDVVIEYYRRKIKYLNPSYVRNLVFQTAVYLSPGGPTELNLRDYCISSNLL